MIRAVLSNPSHPEYGVATIPFPIPHDQYAHCMELLEALEIGDAVKADCKVQAIDSFYSVLKRTEMLTGSPLVGAELLLETSTDGQTWTAVGKITTDKAGIAQWDDLKIGAQYRLTETKAPAGYTLMTEPLFTGTLDSDDPDVTITACNSAGFVLPFTGGVGIAPYFLFAALMLCMGVYFCKKSNIKEKN